MTKRKYNKGYYISSNFKRSSTPTATEDEKLIQNEENEAVTAELENNEFESKSELILEGDNLNTELNDVEAENVKDESNKPSNYSFVKESKNTVKNMIAPIVKMKSTIAEKKAKNSAVSEGDGLSLLWIIIVVLLILWALGFISGNFGGLVHLLLVIALILLILWLLRII